MNEMRDRGRYLGWRHAKQISYSCLLQSSGAWVPSMRPDHRRNKVLLVVDKGNLKEDVRLSGQT